MKGFNRILLAENNSANVNAALAALAKYKLEDDVIVVKDGPEAVDYLCRRGMYQQRAPGNPSIALLDAKTPNTNPVEILQTMRNDERLKDIPVVILSSSDDQRKTIESSGFGKNTFLVRSSGTQAFSAAAEQVERLLGATASTQSETTEHPWGSKL